jgi:hypothetical protein
MPTRWEWPTWSIAARQAAAILLLMAVIHETAVGHAIGPTTQGVGSPSLPPNLVVPAIARPLVTSMWSLSPTFRRQCARLAEHPEVLVRIDLFVGGHNVGGHNGRASAQVARRHASFRVSVEIDVNTSALYVEYIAHELEHVLEAVDGTDLPRLSRQRVDGVINLGGSYETARAQSVGRIVAREVMP